MPKGQRGGNNNPTGKGGFKKGNTHGGRPSRSKEFAELIHQALIEGVPEGHNRAILILMDNMHNAPNRADRNVAAKTLIEHAYGRAPQRIEASGPDGDPIQMSWIDALKASSS